MLLRLLSMFFFFSSRRRHTRLTCDWSSDVCSSDLADGGDIRLALVGGRGEQLPDGGPQRSEERRVGKSVDLGGRRIIKKKKKCKDRQSNDVSSINGFDGTETRSVYQI